MKSLMLLLHEVLTDVGTWCRTSTTRDWETITRRVKHEGLSFLTITLPSFCSDFERSLELGKVDPSLFQAFRKRGELPRFLGGFLDLVFDRSSGLLLNEPNIDAILAIRQTCLLFKKIEIKCSARRTRAAMKKFIECEQDMQEFDLSYGPAFFSGLRRIFLLLWGEVVQKVDEDVYFGRIIPKHGPGSTADKLRGNAKYNQHDWTDRLEEIFPSHEFLLPNLHAIIDDDEYATRVHILEPGAEKPVKVTPVPKTLKTPRLIAIEPTCMQYVQQGLLESFVVHTRNSLAGKFVSYEDQVPNQDMAFVGSRDGSLATLDLSEASDRVSNLLVRHLLASFPHVNEALDASRSRFADVPEHGIIPLFKFASMGSAVCFPIEVMVFLTIIFYAIEQQLNKPLTRKSIKRFSGKVRAFGDDLVVPKEYVRPVVDNLEAFGFKVNTAKSFWNGSFRESCGKEYYAGYDVSVAKCRRMLPTKRDNAAELISTASLRNQLYFSGCWGAARYLDSLMAGLIPWPLVGPDSPVLGRGSFLGYETQKFHQHLHSPLVRGHVVVGRPPSSLLDGYGALLKYFLLSGRPKVREDLNDFLYSTNSGEPATDKEHLLRYGRPDVVYTKRRWAPAV